MTATAQLTSNRKSYQLSVKTHEKCEVFNQASALWQDLWDCDLLIGGGDINARTRDIVDFIPEIDGKLIPKRFNPDTIKNAHADSFISFLKE